MGSSGQEKQNLQNFVLKDDNVQRNKLQKLFSQHNSEEISYYQLHFARSKTRYCSNRAMK